MKTLFVALALVQASNPAVRMDKDGVHFGDRHIVDGAEAAMDVDKIPVQVSSRSVHNLSPKNQKLDVVLAGKDDRTITIGANIKVTREDKRVVLNASRGNIEVTAGDKTIKAKAECAFSVTEKGFDFGKLGALEAKTISVESVK